MSVSDGAILGTLKYNEGWESGPLAGAGNFLAVKFNSTDWSQYTSVKVGLDHSIETGLVEIIEDPDKDGVFKISDKDAQNLMIVCSDGTTTSTFSYDLSRLVCQTE